VLVSMVSGDGLGRFVRDGLYPRMTMAAITLI